MTPGAARGRGAARCRPTGSGPGGSTWRSANLPTAHSSSSPNTAPRQTSRRRMTRRRDGTARRDGGARAAPGRRDATGARGGAAGRRDRWGRPDAARAGRRGASARLPGGRCGTWRGAADGASRACGACAVTCRRSPLGDRATGAGRAGSGWPARCRPDQDGTARPGVDGELLSLVGPQERLDLGVVAAVADARVARRPGGRRAGSDGAGVSQWTWPGCTRPRPRARSTMRDGAWRSSTFRRSWL